jgi:hypothetical protein
VFSGIVVATAVIVVCYLAYVRLNFGSWSPFAIPEHISYGRGAYTIGSDADAGLAMRQLGISASDLTTIAGPWLPTTFYRPSLSSMNLEPPAALFFRTIDGKLHVMHVVGEPW